MTKPPKTTRHGANKSKNNNAPDDVLLNEAILEALPIGVCLTDETGHYRFTNDAYCEIYEYVREEMIGKHYSVIMPPDQIALANAHYERLLKGDMGIPPSPLPCQAHAPKELGAC